MSDFPTILVIQTYDTADNEITGEKEVFKYDKKEYKLDELKEFLEEYIRADKKEPLED